MVSGVEAITTALRAVLPAQAVDLLASSSMLTRFNTITRGVLDVRDLFYFASTIILFLFINACVIEYERAA